MSYTPISGFQGKIFFMIPFFSSDITISLSLRGSLMYIGPQFMSLNYMYIYTSTCVSALYVYTSV